MYVRRTQELCYEVLKKVDEMRHKAREPYEAKDIEVGMPEYDALYNSVEDVVWKEAPELKGKLPDEWLKKSTHDHVFVEVPRQTTGKPYGSYDVSLRVPDGSKLFKLTPQYTCESRYSRHANVKFDKADIPPVVSDFFAKEEEQAVKRGEVDGKYLRIRQKLELFMGGHASLNKMIAAMPEFEHYVPQRFLDKLRQPNEKRDTKVEINIVDDLGIDANELAGLAVGHRLATARS